MSTQYEQPSHSGPPQGYDTRPTSVAAIIGLIGAFVFWPVGLVASIIGITHTRPGRKKGRGLAIAGLVISVLAAIATAIVIAIIVAVVSSPEVQQSVRDANDSMEQLQEGLDATTGDATGDVVITACQVEGMGLLTATATVTNSTGAAATYAITASADDAQGNRLAEMNGFVNALAAGQSTNVELTGTLDEAPEGMQCVVADVTRIPS